jgi:hypothetical protein
MKRGLVFAFIVGFTSVVRASDNSVEVTLEDTPEHPRSFEAWGRKPAPEEVDSDGDSLHWRYKFEAGSDKRIGSAADEAAIKALVPPTISPTIRWVSRSVVVVTSGCYLDASPNHVLRCLYVFEKHASKWKLTHHYRWPSWMIF